MKYSRSAITQLTRWYKQVLIKCAILNAAIMAGTFGAPAVADATEINQNGVPFKTVTDIAHAPDSNIWNISTSTTSGDIGINTFGKFNISEGDIANLNLSAQQKKLANLVFDSSASQINGIVNSYKNGQIGGDVLFANPNGFVVGKTGVFNVGSLTLMTPTEDTMKKVFKDNAVVEDNLNALVSFNMGGTDYLLLGGEETDIELNPAEISIDGTINSGAGITIANGGTEININKDAKLNANMDFSVSGGNVTATKKTGVTPTSVTKTEKELSNGKTEVSLEYKLAMDGGNGIAIVSKNQKVDNDYLAAIVNLNGKVDANGGNVIAQTEIYNSGSRNVSDYNKDTKPKIALSKVTVGGEVDGNDIALNARTIATNFNNDIANIDAEWLEWLETPANFIVSDFVHKAKMKSSVEVLDSAKINATGDFSANANTSFVASATSIMENLAFNYTSVDVVTEAILRSGSTVKAKNLNVLSTADVRLSTSAKSTNIIEMAFDAFDKSFGHGGAYSVSIVLADVSNRAVIEEAVNLEVAKNILVDAEMYRTYSGSTKNGLLPIVDNNFGTAGAAAGLFIGNTTNEAIMDSSADITGTLDVEANYVGATVNSVSASASAKGESSQAGGIGKIFMFMIDKGSLANTGTANERSYTRAKGSFDKIKVAAAVGVSVDNVTNTARIGNKEKNVKPNIKAGNIVLKADLLDNKSNLYVSASAGNGETAISGAVAVNIKNLTSDANAHGDFTIKGSSFEYVAQKDGETLLLQDGSKLIAAKEGDKLTQNYNAYVYTATKDDVVEKEVNGVKKTYIKLPNGAEVEGQVGDKVVVPIDGFNIEANTRVTHGMAFIDWAPALADWVGGLFDTVSSKIKSPKVESIQSQDANEYLSATTKAKDIQEKVDGAGNMNILNILDFTNLGTAYFFNTFALSSSDAAAKETATSAYSGAFAIAVHNTVAKAILDDNSSVLFKANNEVNNTLNVNAYTNDQLWSGAVLGGLSGMAARDGDSKGGALSFQWGSPETIANIGENVTVKQENSAYGDVVVKALDETDDINVAIANGAADESGLAGAISISAIDGGKVEAAVKSSNVTNAINGRDVIVNADKDLTHVNANFGFTAAQDAKGIGISVNYADDEAVAYIAGNVNATRDVTVDADYDKLFINGAFNMGYAKSGTDTPRYGNISDEQREMNMDQGYKLLNKADMLQADNTKYFRFFRSMWNARKGNEALANSDYDFTRALNPDKQTASKAGMISVSISEAAAKAYIDDGANILAGNNVKVEATSEDMLINGAIAMAIHGKSGMGGAFIGQWTQNTVEAYIGNAVVDALGDINVNAKEDLKLFTGSVGIAQGQDKSVAGNISLDLQSNTVTAAIKEGAKINTQKDTDNANQSVNVTAGVESHIIKGIGSVSVQAGGSGNGGAKGGTLDGDIALNEINAYIKGAEVNAGKELNVKATNETNLITVDVAGAVSTSDSAYSGALGAYVSINEENAYIEDSQINTTEDRTNKGADINVVASSTFDDLAIVGTVAYGDGSSADASIRVDGIGDEINSYIKNSTIDTNGNILLDNDSEYDYLAVTAAGAISKGSTAFSGAVAIAVNTAVQESHIEASEIKAGSLTMDSDAKYDALAITGVAVINLTGKSIGGSVFVSVIDNDIDNYIKNSNITAKNDVNMTSDLDIDSLSIIFAGSGGKGFAASGAVSAIVNSADVNTYIKSDNDDKKIISEAGKVVVKSTNDTDIKTINGAISISIGSDAAGAGINVVVDSSDVSAGIENTSVSAKEDVDIEAKADEDIMSISIGGAGGNGITVAGSINTVVMTSDTSAYIKDADVTSDEGDIKVISSGETEITGGTGSASISLSSMALGASIVTGVIDSEVKATIENSKAYAGKDVIVSAEANETIGEKNKPFITVAGGFSQGLTVEGVIATMVMSSTADAHIIGTKTINDVAYGVNAGRDVAISAEGKDTIFAIDGAISASTSAGVGATVNTIVIDKDVKAYAQNAKIEATNDIKAQAKETDDFFTTVVAAAGGGTAGAAGAVNTNVITSKLDAGYKDSTLRAGNKISSNTEAKANMQTITGSAGGGGSVGVGLSAVNDVIRYTAESKATGVNAEFKELDVKSKADSTYEYTTVSGAAAGTVSVVGVENVNYVNNTIKAYADGILKGNKALVDASDKVTFVHPIAGTISVGGTAGVGATVMVNSVTSTIDAYIGGSDIQVSDIDVKAKGEQIYDHIVAAGFAGAGVAGVSGTVLVNDVDTFVHAYISDGAKVKAEDVDIDAQNKITLTSFTGAGAVGGAAAFGASVDVNNFKSTTEAYTGDGVAIEAKNVDIKAKTETNLGKPETENKMIVASGSFGLYAGIAGSVLWSGIENRTVAHIGANNVITLADEGHLNLNATDISKIYESVGGGAGGLVGVGASVGGNEIHNTVLASVGTDTVIEGENADVNISANSSETVDALGVIVGGGAGALSGGAVYVHIGDKEDNASTNNYDNQSEEERKTFDGAQKQKDEMSKAAGERNTSANKAYQDAYNGALGRIKNQSKGTRLADKEQVSGSLYDLTNRDVIGGTDRKGTAAFIDTAAQLNVKNLNIAAQNTNDVKLESIGAAAGGAAIGVSVTVAEDKTTTNAFVQNGTKITADSVQISANSEDKHRLDAYAATGGIIAGNGSVAVLKSDKTTNAYVNDDAIINALNNLNIGANSHSDNEAYAWSGSFGGVVIGMSIANAKSIGKTRIDLGDNVTLTSDDSDIIIRTDTNENTRAEAWAATGGVGGGGAALSTATSGKDNTVNIGKNFSAETTKKLAITSNAVNKADTESNGRAYGGVSAGGANGTSNIDQTSGVNIKDADTAKTIKAASIEISSKAENDAESTVYAGAGAILGISASKAETDIKSTNKSYVGKNYDISAIEGGYSLSSDTMNKYKSYVKSDSYGVVTVAIPKIRNTVNSTVTTDSEADVTSKKDIVVKAANEISKASVYGYDLYGGAGGLASGSGGSIKDELTMNTSAKLGGNRARAEGDFGNGRVDVSAYNIANINEKADLYAHGGIAGADTDSIVKLTADADVEIANKDVTTKDDHISYVARNDVDIYTKVNVESYGGVAGAGGESNATSSKQTATVTIDEGVKSVSGRDTNISALSNKSLEAYINAETGGLISIVGGEADAHNKDSKAIVTIASGSEVKSFDSMNITAQSSTQKLRAKRDALAYQLGFIPYHGSGNEYTTNNNTSSIVIDGEVESGLGAYKHLVINQDGTYESENDAISVSQEKIGEITSANLQVDIDSYKESKTNLTNEHNAYIQAKNVEKSNHQTDYNNALAAKGQLETQNQNLTTLKDNASELLKNITNALNEATATEDMANIGTNAYAEKYGSIPEVQKLIEAYKNLVSNKNDETEVAFGTAWGELLKKQVALPTEIANYETQIKTNNNTIATHVVTMNTAQNAMDDIDAEIIKTTEDYQAHIASLDASIADAETQKALAQTEAIPVYSINVGDVFVRSGETNINGATATGNGSITAAGAGSFAINIENNSVSNVYYNNLIIDRNLKYGINGNVGGNITKNIKNALSEGPIIKIVNSVDKNDPTINLGTNAGDIVLQGNIENVLGAFDVTNNTGDVFTQGNLTVKDLHMKVPNGAYNQLYINQEQKLGGASGAGAIVAAGDIDIAAKTIDVNGLLQSGTEIKKVEIPEFSVIKKEDGNYYQVMDNQETIMQKGTTDGYYYITLPKVNDNSDINAMQTIRAYFKPTDESNINNIAGDIYLFKANTSGGNITLTGNVISTQNTGKIVLMNGYGHIDVVNNSAYNLVTSSLGVDTKMQGKLTINDFKVDTKQEVAYSSSNQDEAVEIKTVPNYSLYDTITQNSLTPEFLATHADTHTAYVGEDGISFTSKGDKNGTWSEGSMSVRNDGATVYSTTYTPGDDAWTMTKEGGSYSYQRYVERSWIVELFCGKKYETVYVNYNPTYEVQKKAIAVNFQGFDKPEINITSKSDVVMNNSISALSGDVNITSQGSIMTNSLNNVITANNINLTSNNNIGQVLDEVGTIRPLMVEIVDNGTLTAKAENNVYVRYPYSDISNIDISGKNVQLSSAVGNMDMNGKKLKVSADDLLLNADKVNLDISQAKANGSDLQVGTLSARASDDITFVSDGSFTVKSLISDNKGNINLESKSGSIYAADSTGTYLDEHIYGGDIVLKAVNGEIGTPDKPLTFSNAGIFNVQSNGDIYMKSADTMYVDLISSKEGSLNLNANFGIIASAITDTARVYNLYAGGDMNLVSAYGNIENILVNLDGVLSASAGYKGTENVAGWGDVNVSLISEIAQADETGVAELTGTKDLKIGIIQATNNVTINSEKGVKNAVNTSSVSGERIIINAVGDVGEQNSAINVTANREITVLSKGGSNVYLKTDDAGKGLKISRIDTTNGEGSLGNVELTSAGNITQKAIENHSTSEDNADENITNIKAESIKLTATGKNIGAADRYFVVETTSTDANKGLVYAADKAYIKGVGDVLKVAQGDTTGISDIRTEDIDIIADNITSEGNVLIISNKNITANNIKSDNDTHSTYILIGGDGDVTLSNVTSGTVLVSGQDVTISDNITTDFSVIHSLGKTTLENADVKHLTDEEAYLALVNVTSDDDVIVKDTVIGGDTRLESQKDTNIFSLTVDGNLTNTSDNTTVSGKLDVSGDVNIDANKNILIADANIGKDLNANAKNIKISEVNLGGNLNAKVDDIDVSTSNDLHIGTISGNTSDYTNTADITSLKNITNGLDNADTNISVKNADLTAGNSIGKDKALNMELAEGNKVNITAGNVANLNNTGAAANYGNVTADDTKITATNDVNIANLKTDKLALTTKSENVNITGDIKTKGTIGTASKNIVVDNTSLAPYPYDTVQLYLTKKPMHLSVDKSNNIRTESLNVTRHSMNTLVNKEAYATSMEGEITLASEVGLKNSYHGQSAINEADDMLYRSSSVSDYIADVVSEDDNHLIKAFHHRILDDSNIMSIINQTKADQLQGEKYSSNEKKKKVL